MRSSLSDLGEQSRLQDMTHETRAALLSRLADLGVRGDAADQLAKATAPARHRVRVEAAEIAALEVALGGETSERVRRWAYGLRDDAFCAGPLHEPAWEPGDEEIAEIWRQDRRFAAAACLEAAVRCLVELIGPYGGGLAPWANATPGTARLPEFRGLGSGRRYAGDGGAWDSAIADAGLRLAHRVFDLDPAVRLVADDGEIEVKIGGFRSPVFAADEDGVERRFALFVLHVDHVGGVALPDVVRGLHSAILGGTRADALAPRDLAAVINGAPPDVRSGAEERP